MSKYTNLEAVQTILSAIDSDNVNGVSDTEEAVQVSLIMRRVFDEISSRFDWKFQDVIKNPIALSDVNDPTAFKIPMSLNAIKQIRYRSMTDPSTAVEDTPRYPNNNTQGGQ